jgi:FtsP/CotA-like multicopper oxidase with cupredoxin domain
MERTMFKGSISRSCDRRSFLMAAARAGTGVAAANLARVGGGMLASGAALFAASRAVAKPGDLLVQPPEIRSRNGVLAATLTAAPGRVSLGDLSFPGLLYNGSYLPPLLRARLGDTLRITLKNELPDQPTNLHYHGMSVSPQGNSDNVFVDVHPGQQFEYEVPIPVTGRQGPGLFWYHPHAHGFVDKQVLGGLSGALVIDGSEELFPMLQGLPERFFLIKDPYRDEDTQVLAINGQINPLVQIRPGQMQLWRIANIGAELFIKLHVEGMALYVIATDGHALTQPHKITQLFLGAGQRVDAIVIGPPAGEYAMATIQFKNEAWKTPAPSQQIATIVSSGPAVSLAALEPQILGQRVRGETWIDEVRAAPIARRRTIVYSRTPDRRTFFINGRVMDMNRVDETVQLGDTEEWTIVNTDQQYHSFHIHQTPFLVTEVNGVRKNDTSLHDTFPTPPATDGGSGTLKVVIPFTDPVIVGRFVYHCHAADHEDKGMMGVVEVVAPGQPPLSSGNAGHATHPHL